MDELDASARLRVRLSGLAAAVIAALAVSVSGNAVRQPLDDLFQRIWPADYAKPQVQVVLIDAPSLAAVGGWPWSRYVMARLTEAIASRGAKAIGFDFLFPEADRTSPELFANLYPELPADAAAKVRALPSMDAVFARVIGRSPVVLARAGVAKGSYDALGAAAPLPPEAAFMGDSNLLASYPEVVANLPILDGAALGHGLVNGPHDADGVLRRVPLVARAAGALTPGFALELVRIAEGEAGARIEGGADAALSVRLGTHWLKMDDQGRMALRFGDLPATATTSAADLLRSGVPADALRGKIVIVGLTAAGTSDVVTTPRQAETFGVLVQAQAVEAILRGAVVSRPDLAPAIEWALGLLLAAAAWRWVPRRSLSDIVAGVIAAAVMAIGGTAVAFLHGLVFDPGPVLAPGAATAAAMIGVLFVEGRQAQRRLRTALDEERVAAAKVAGELAAAAEIQAGMLLPREALRQVSDAVGLDAVLQPARSVGGDLYDAFLIAPGRLCVLVGDVTGKGVPAALFMALAKALSRSLLAQPGLALAEAVGAIDAELSRDNGQMMAVALLIAVLDLATGELQLISAGHENPLVVAADGAVRALRLDGGPPLCATEGFSYPVETADLAPGETLVLVTDGVTEAHAPGGDLFGRDRAMAAVAGTGRSPSELIDALVAAVRAFEAGGEPSDDLTVLALRRRS